MTRRDKQNNSRFTEDQLLDHIVFLIETDDAKDAPPQAMKFALDLFRSQSAQIELKPQTLVEKLLGLVTLEWSPSFVFGERSGGFAAAKQIFVETNEFDIDFRIEQADDEISVFGQVLGENWQGKALELRSERFSAQTEISEDGEFAFEKMPSGEYQLVLRESV